jgi:GDPmannose 4,6-dehydratase
MRPAEVDHLLGDASRARTELGWAPTVGFEQLIAMMVDADVARHQARLRAGQAGGPVPVE